MMSISPDDFAAQFEASPHDDLETILNRPPNQGQHFIQLVAMLIVLFVTIGVIIHLGLPAASSPAQRVFGPSLLITSNISEGMVILNGKTAMAHFPYRANPQKGTNILTMRVPPFRPHTCHFSWPDIDASVNDCGNGDVTDAQSVAIDFSLADLPPTFQSQLSSLLTDFSRALPPLQTDVPAGQFYATGSDADGIIHSVLATAPLTASVTFAVDTTQIVFGGDVTPADADVSHVWFVALPFGLTWNFTRADGVSMGSYTIPFINDLEIGITYAATGFAAVRSHTLTNTIATQVMQSLCRGNAFAIDALQRTAKQGIQGTWVVQHDNGIEGCLVQLNPLVIGSTAPPAITFVYRFGVLLASNQQAHNIFLAIPVAPPAEVSQVST